MGRIKRTREQIENDICTQSKICCVCEERKSFSEFYNFQNKSDGKSYRCKVCDELAKKEWANKNPESRWKSARKRKLWSVYRITLETYYKILESQGGCCKICGKSESENKVSGIFNSLSVDHNHETGEIRGLLCNQCNRALGMLLDSPELLRKAADYIEKC